MRKPRGQASSISLVCNDCQKVLVDFAPEALPEPPDLDRAEYEGHCEADLLFHTSPSNVPQILNYVQGGPVCAAVGPTPSP